MHRGVHDLLFGRVLGRKLLDDAALAADQDAIGEEFAPTEATQETIMYAAVH